MPFRKLCLLGTCIVLTGVTHADPNDFVNPKYVVAAKGDPATSGARSTIVRNADVSAKEGPWTVTDSNIRATTNDPHDYLSWAPYHWPDCNWCGQTKSTNDKRPPDNGEDDGDENHGEDGDDDDHEKKKVHAGYGSKTNEENPPDNPSSPSAEAPMLGLPHTSPDNTKGSVPAAAASPPSLGLLKVMNSVLDLFGSKQEPRPIVESPAVVPTNLVIQPPVTQLGSDPHPTSAATSSLTLPDATGNPALDSILPAPHLATIIGESPLAFRDQFLGIPGSAVSTESAATTALSAPLVSSSHLESIAHTASNAPNPTALPLRGKKGKTTSSCTPSPTTSMPPSATWTTCPYKARDGRVNPDVRQLKNAAEVVDMSQASIWNAVAAVSSGSKSATYAKNVVSFIDTFFLNDATKMNPNAEFGQVVRGPPGTQEGSYMGVLDFRGMVKVVNAILVLREMKSQEWTPDRDTKMSAWASAYVQWVETDPVGKKAARAANNHGSFYPNQIAALKALVGDMNGARAVLQSYFANQFQEQIIASGEQPLEAVRTRPFHYRCFNLEAIITNAKLGDYLGMNYWSYKTKYGATIQTAVNYVMSLNPGEEKVDDALPHVAAVAATYGDPQGKYAAYLKAGNKNYAKKPFWFYDQPGAIMRGQAKHRQRQQDEPSPSTSGEASAPSTRTQEIEASKVDEDHPPMLFANGSMVELEEGFFVGWKDVRGFYRRLDGRRIREERRRTRVKRALPRQAPTPPPMFQDGKEVELEEGEEVNWDNIKKYYEPSVSANPA